MVTKSKKLINNNNNTKFFKSNKINKNKRILIGGNNNLNNESVTQTTEQQIPDTSTQKIAQQQISDTNNDIIKQYTKAPAGSTGYNGLDSVINKTKSGVKVFRSLFKELYIGTDRLGKALGGSDFNRCSFIREKKGDENLNKKKIDVIIKKNKFFKKEDDFFKSLYIRNHKRFCYENKEEFENNFFSRICSNIIEYCFSSPDRFIEIVDNLINPEETVRMFYQLPDMVREELIRRIENENIKEIKDLIKKGILGDKEEKKLERYAYFFSKLQDENLVNFSKYFKNVVIQTFINYKDEGSNAPSDKYKGEIVMEAYLTEILRIITKAHKKSKGDVINDEQTQTIEEEKLLDSEGNNVGASQTKTIKRIQLGGDSTQKFINYFQSGGATYEDLSIELPYKELLKKKQDSAQTPEEKKMYTPLSISELKKINESDIIEGVKDCGKRDSLLQKKKSYDKGEEITGTDFDNEELDIDVAASVDSPKFGYIVVGCLLLVSIIESGFLDAPPCMTHTMI